MMDMDDVTLQRHIRLTRKQFEDLTVQLGGMGLEPSPIELGGSTRIRLEVKVLMFLWYMGNQNSFREISDKFNVSQGTAHETIISVLDMICQLSAQYIKWPNRCERQVSAAVFSRRCGMDRIIGAIDGCHIRIIRPRRHGVDYLNRKGYYSMLLQGICNDEGRFLDIFTGPPGRIHDARLLRLSDFYANWQETLGNDRLLGDCAYIGNAFHFIETPIRDNGRLTEADQNYNLRVSRGRVIIENAFGRLKCRFRRLRELQNTRLDVMVKVIIAGCTLHNYCLEDGRACPEHPEGCPQDEDMHDAPDLLDEEMLDAPNLLDEDMPDAPNLLDVDMPDAPNLLDEDMDDAPDLVD